MCIRDSYLTEVINHHVSGQLKIAPEHTDLNVLHLMGKPSSKSLDEFRQAFEKITKKAGKEQYLTYYLIAAYPGCSDADMRKLKQYAIQSLKVTPEQVQVFTPTPSTYASVMYYTETDPYSGQKIFVEKNLTRKTRQKEIITEDPTSTILFRKKSAGFNIVDGYAKFKHHDRDKK
jgi:radical SAM superfamily enzyme YgiQ (UPF0313 family)